MWSYDTEGGTKGLGREGSLELGTDSSRVAMGTGHLSVDGTAVGAILLDLGTVDKGNTLAEVPLGLFSRVHALELDNGGLGALQVLTTLVAEMASLGVETLNMGYEYH